MRLLPERLAADRETGLTVIELLVASAMSVVLVGAAGSMLISAVQDQPSLSKRAQAVSTERTVLEKMTRDFRNGFYVYAGASSSSVSLKTRVRHASCGSTTAAGASSPAIECKVTYACTGSTSVTCTRTETNLESSTGTAVTVATGLASANVFNYSPNAEEPAYIGATLQVADPEGGGKLSISDGAELRTLGLPG